jgi:hypothetical protein
MEEQVLRILKYYPKKRIETKVIVEELKKCGTNIFGNPELNKDFVISIRGLIEKEILIPLKNSKSLMQYEGISNKFDINIDSLKVDRSTLPSSELISFHRKIDPSYYAKHPDEFYENEKFIRKINALLRQKDCPTLTANERSYLIFGDEKALTLPKEASIDGQDIIRKLGNLRLEDLKANKTFEPFFYYMADDFDVIRNGSPRNVLIVENKDTFWTLMDAIKNKSLSHIHLLIYGEGKAIIKKFEFIEYLKGEYSDHYHYFGDIDLEGVFIYNKLRESFAEYDIAPAVPFYEHMLKVAGVEGSRNLKNIRNSKKSSLSPFIDYFNIESAELIEEIIQRQRCLPQEVLNNNDIEEWCKIELQ